MSLNKVGRRRGFRLSPRRFSVYRLRVRFLYFIRLLNRWKSSLKKGISRCSGCKRSSNKGMAIVVEGSFNGSSCNKLRNYGRSNSFYSEAIADCLEFIKRSSVSVDDDNSVVQR